MKFRLFLIPSIGSLVLPVAGLSAGEAPDVLTILQKADASAKAVKAIRYDAEFFGEGEDRFVRRTGHVRGTVIVREARRSLMTNIFGGGTEIVRYEGEVKLPSGNDWVPFKIASDGRTVYRIDPQSKTYIRGNLPLASQLLRRGGFLLMQEFVHPTPFSDEINGKEARYEGEQEIVGVACYVVYVVYRDGSESRWYFGKEDYLPRRVDRIVGRTSQNAQVRIISNIDTNPEIDLNTFRLAIPDGYVERTFDLDEFDGAPQKLLPHGSVAPDFDLRTPDNRHVRLHDLRGNVVVLDFWATWCGPCKLAMPGVQRIHEKFSDKPVKVFGISTWERQDADPADFMKQGRYTYGLLLDGDQVAELYKLEGLPTFYIIDAGGRVVYASTGFLPDKEEEITETIEKALEAPTK